MSPSDCSLQHIASSVWGGGVTEDLETDGLCCLVNAQMQEMDMVRQKVYQLEQTQIQIKQKYVYHARDGLLISRRERHDI